MEGKTKGNKTGFKGGGNRKKKKKKKRKGTLQGGEGKQQSKKRIDACWAIGHVEPGNGKRHQG